MNTRLSFSAISTYTTCGYKYYLRYRKNYRGKYFHAPLAFGSAIDGALNKLLTTKSLEEANVEFDKLWNFQYVNKKYVALPTFTELVYAETDFDVELLHEEDTQKLTTMKDDLVQYDTSYLDLFDEILENKKSKGWDNLNSEDKAYYNYANWLSMRRKGLIMLDSYNRKVMPRIKEVVSVQKENYLTNQDGDKIVQYLDLIVKWEDDKIILFDNKTSARDYDDDSASRSPQLVSYFHGAREEFNLQAIGFLVLKKGILKNKIKICPVCNHDGTGSRAKTCDNEFESAELKKGKPYMVRCRNEWQVTIRPECDIQIIINNVYRTTENLVLETFDQANQGIKKENWYRNLSACRSSWGKCEFDGLCWYNDQSGVLDMNQVAKDEF